MCGNRWDGVVRTKRHICHTGTIKITAIFFTRVRWGYSYIALIRKTENGERSQLKLHVSHSREKVKSFLPTLNANGQTSTQWKRRLAETEASFQSILNNSRVQTLHLDKCLDADDRRWVGEQERGSLIYCLNVQPWMCCLLLSFSSIYSSVALSWIDFTVTYEYSHRTERKCHFCGCFASKQMLYEEC